MRIQKNLYKIEDKYFKTLHELAEHLGGKVPNTVRVQIKNQKWDKLGCVVEIVPNPDYVKKETVQRKAKKNEKVRKCTRCKSDFITEVDSRGMSISTRCPKCKAKEKRTK